MRRIASWWCWMVHTRWQLKSAFDADDSLYLQTQCLKCSRSVAIRIPG